MSILDLCMEEINNAVEPFVVGTTEECKIRITNYKTGDNKNGNPYALFTFVAPDFPGSKAFTKYLPIIHQGMDADERNRTARKWKAFLTAFDIDATGGLDMDSIIGLECWALLGVEQPQEGREEYGESNYIKKFIG